jgi:exonuclease SbcC
MIPLRLNLSGFLSYQEPVSLDFTGFDLACIAGENGAGKSSLLDAITWALFGRARRTDESIINLHPDTQAAEVGLIFRYEGNIYRVLRANPRNKTSTLEFQIATDPEERNLDALSWKPLSERSIRETQKRVEEMLRMDYDTFVNAAFFLQGRADQFTQQTAARRKAILSNILGLGVWESYRFKAVNKRKAVDESIQRLDGRLAEIQAELDEEDQRKASLAALQKELSEAKALTQTQEELVAGIQAVQQSLDEQQKIVDVLARQLTGVRQQHNELLVRREARAKEQSELKGVMLRAEEIRATYQDLLQAREQLTALDKTAQSYHQQEKRRQGPRLKIDSEKSRLEADLSVLKPQLENINKLRRDQPTIASQFEVVQTAVQLAQTRLDQRSELDTKLQEALQRNSEAKAENPRLKEEMDDLKERIAQLEVSDSANCPICGQPLAEADRLSLIVSLEGQGKLKGDRFRANKTLLDESDRHVSELQTQITALHPIEKELQRHHAELTSLEQRQAAGLAQLEDWDAVQQPRMSAIETSLVAEDFAQEARRELAEIDSELKDIGYDAAEHDRARDKVARAGVIEDEFRQLERAEAALEQIDREVESLDDQLEARGNELETQQKEHDDAVAKLAAAQSQAPDLVRAQQDFLGLRENELTIAGKVGRANRLVDDLDEKRDRKKLLKAEREEMTIQVARYKQLERAFGKDGVPALLIEQALPQIEAKANELLDRLSAGEMNIRFLTQRELKSREDMKETLDIQISDRAGVRDYEMFSGGEAFRINFAIRLALSDVLTRRAGAKLQTLVLDEGFGSQDEAGRQRLIEAINTVRDDFKTILVITHIESLKDAFPTRIEVIKGERGSRVSVVL